MWKTLKDKTFVKQAGSEVLTKQELMFSTTFGVLTAMAEDVRQGLLETVGIESEFSISGEHCAMILDLPSGTDNKMIAEAIALENADAWCDENNRVNLGLNPWFSTKDVDQTVLCTVKVIHVLLGLHAVCEIKPKTFSQKLLKSFIEVLQIEKELKNV